MNPKLYPKLFRGPWPKNVSRAAKYSLRHIEDEWKVTVLYQCSAGERFLAVDGNQDDLVAKVNTIKESRGGGVGGVFYINEYCQILVPVPHREKDGTNVHVFYAGMFEGDLSFQFEGKPLYTAPIHSDGSSLKPGDEWVGPRPGIAYVLKAGGNDIYYETPALSGGEQPKVRPGVSRKVFLSRVLGAGGAWIELVPQFEN